jgi:hypothetical protein
MTQADFALMATVFAATLFLAAFLGAREGNAKADTALMGGSGLAFAAVAGVLFAA